MADVHTGDGTALLGERAFLGSPEQAAMMISATVEGFPPGGHGLHLKALPPAMGTRSKIPCRAMPPPTKPGRKCAPVSCTPSRRGWPRGADAVMVAHITTPNATEDGLPASLSYEMITQNSGGRLRFQRVVITDSSPTRPSPSGTNRARPPC